eukprot:scaffold184829_cov30-Tisochrysis_lutea.AAC.1
MWDEVMCDVRRGVARRDGCAPLSRPRVETAVFFPLRALKQKPPSSPPPPALPLASLSASPT